MTHPDIAPLFDERAIRRELHDARSLAIGFTLGNRCIGDHALSVVAVRHIDAAIRTDNHIVRLIEVGAVVAGLAGRSQAQQQLAGRAELVHLLTLGAVSVGSEVGNPHVALGIHMDAVRSHHDASAEIGDNGTGGTVKLEDRVDNIGIASHWSTGAEAACAATLVGPDLAIIRVDVDTGCRTPGAACWQCTPVLSHNRVWIGHAFAGDVVAGWSCRRGHRSRCSRCSRRWSSRSGWCSGLTAGSEQGARTGNGGHKQFF